MDSNQFQMDLKIDLKTTKKHYKIGLNIKTTFAFKINKQSNKYRLKFHSNKSSIKK